jgi:hypothetical protein
MRIIFEVINLEKKIIALALIICLVFVIAHVLGAQSWFTKTEQPVQTAQPIPTDTSSSGLTQTDVDRMWQGSAHAYMNILGSDLNATSFDNNTTIEQYQKDRTDINLILSDDIFDVSPKYQHAKEEWHLSLIAIDNCVNASMQLSNYTNNETKYNETCQYADEQYKSAQGHENNFTTEMNNLIFQPD